MTGHFRGFWARDAPLRAFGSPFAQDPVTLAIAIAADNDGDMIRMQGLTDSLCPGPADQRPAHVDAVDQDDARGRRAAPDLPAVQMARPSRRLRDCSMQNSRRPRRWPSRRSSSWAGSARNNSPAA